MKKYIKPEVWCIEALFESLLAAESGQIEEGDAKRHNYTLFMMKKTMTARHIISIFGMTTGVI